MLSRRDSFKQVDAKFVLLGTRNVGKSDSTYQFTATIDDDQANLEVLDPGPQGASELRDRSVESRAIWADGVLLVYSITDRKSFEEVESLHRLINPFKHKTVAAILGNKSDLEHERKVSKEEGASMAEKLKCPFFECSASEGYQKVAEVFHEIYREVARKKKAERRMSLSPRPLRNALGKVFRRNSSKNLLLTTSGTLTTY